MLYPIHLFSAACILTAGFYLYIYLSNPFWCRQPVVHTYDLWRRWGPLFGTNASHKILYDSTVIPTKYYFPEKTRTFNPLEEPEHLKQCIELLQSHYISADDVLFSIQEAYLTCLLYTSDAADDIL
jgi:hypothetical protein